MKDITSLIIGLILGTVIGAFGGYQYSEQQNQNLFKINIDQTLKSLGGK